jgi:precorrin-6B methylase 2
MNLKDLISSLVCVARKEGFWSLKNSIRERFYINWFDKPLGILTEGNILSDELGHTSHLFHEYCPTDYHSIRHVLGSLKIKSGEGAFLDFGSGLGRVVIQAALHPFRRVIGIDISPKLNIIAQENIEKSMKRFRCKNVQIITSDAAEFDIPNDVTVIYFYNPFRGEVLHRVMANIHQSLNRHPRLLRVVCNVPPSQSEFEEEIQEASWLKLKKSISYTKIGPNQYRYKYLFLESDL